MRVPVSRVTALLAVVLHTGVGGLSRPAEAQDHALPRYLRDRGSGIPSSLSGSYISRGQLLVYPFFGYSLDNNREYQPAKLGVGLNQDFRGRFRSSEALLFVGYGVTDWLALEFEAAFINATLRKSPSDPSAVPARIKQSGVGDFEGQLRLRLLREGDHRPEIFGFLELTPASQKRKVLIAEPDWDLKPGLGVVRGFSWGTMTLLITGEKNHEAGNLDLGEVAIEYLKRLSPAFRLHLGIEGGEGGAPDEFSLLSGVEWRMTNTISLKLDNAVGIQSKATDWAPEIGLMFSFPR